MPECPIHGTESEAKPAPGDPSRTVYLCTKPAWAIHVWAPIDDEDTPT
jgi:hypothetical protein